MLGKELLKKYNNTKNFFNRDLSWIEFNRRVLEEALNPHLPLLEKVKFISIFHTNLDEFYMIRVSGLKEQIAADVLEPTIDGLTPLEQVRRIEKILQPMLKTINGLWQNDVTPALKKNGIIIAEYDNLPEKEKGILTEYFKNEILSCTYPACIRSRKTIPLYF